jgi:hypothetical protein
MKFSRATLLSLASALAVNAQSFCSNAKHSGQSVVVNSNKVGSIGGVGYELWADSGSNSATFYSDGSFSCSFRSAKDYLCRAGLSFNSDKTHQQLGHMYADFKLVKQGIQNVDYSYVGIYGWTRNPLVEFYVVDNWLSQYRPGDWVGNKKHGDFTIDGAQYTVYENTRYGPSIEGNTNFKQYFSIRKTARDCGTIDITAHFQQWEKLGMTMGKMHEAKVLGEAGSNGGGTTGTADFPYAKVYIGNGQQQQTTTTRKTTTTRRTTTTKRTTTTRVTIPTTGICSSKITRQGYKCCASNCEVVYTDDDGTWGVENNQWCGCGVGTCKGAQGYPCCKTNTVVYYTDNDGKWSVENNDWCLIP